MKAQSQQTTVSERLGQNVKLIREQREMSQTALAAAMTDAGFANFFQTTVSRIESGRQAVRLEEAYGLARVLDVSIDHLTRELEQAQVLVRFIDTLSKVADAQEQITDGTHRLLIYQGDLAERLDAVTRLAIVDKDGDLAGLIGSAQQRLTETPEQIVADTREAMNNG